MKSERITSRKNAAVKRLRELAKDKSERQASGEFVCDGEKLFYEAISSGVEITSVLVSGDADIRIPELSDACCYIAPKDVLESVTTLKTAQNIIFSCRMKRSEPENIRRAILLDGLQDTGNIGTIIRTADAFGIDAVIVDNCADVYNPKTIRSAMGSIFRIPVINGDLRKIIPDMRKDGYKIYCSELYGNVITISDCDFEKCGVVIGNEGNGVRREISQLCDKSVIIPMQGGAESLNAAVAASIFMYKMSER